ncbi:MAG: hypothetical protein NTZ93_01780 [Candidatus Beckwithbacteria bacterium]|nr:hypothetical protein [Candidatus Beckwithbacteria bacterium]
MRIKNLQSKILYGLFVVLFAFFIQRIINFKIRAADTNLSGGDILAGKNLTLGNADYVDPVSGNADQTLRLRVRIVNQGTVDAENVRVKFNLGNGVAPLVEISADNSGSQSDIVNLNPGGSSLNFITGSGKKYGPVCPSGCSVGDEVVSSGVSLGNVSPGEAQSYQISIELQVVGVPNGGGSAWQSGNIFDGGNRTDRTTGWEDPIPADPGEVIEFRVLVNNSGQSNIDNTSVRASFPDSDATNITATALLSGSGAEDVSDNVIVNVSGTNGQRLVYIPGHTLKWGPGCSSGCSLPDGITIHGVSLGTVEPGTEKSYQVTFKAYVSNQVPSPSPSPSASPSPSPSASPNPSPSVSPSPSLSPSPSPSPNAPAAGFIIRKFKDSNQNGAWDNNETSTGLSWHFQYRINSDPWQDYYTDSQTGWGGEVSISLGTKVEIQEAAVNGWVNTTNMTQIKVLDQTQTYYFDFGNYLSPEVVKASPPVKVPATGQSSHWWILAVTGALGIGLQIVALLL